MRNTAGLIIRNRRKELGESLGAMAKLVKCSDSHLSDVEHGKRRPTIKMIARLATALQMDNAYVCLIFGRVPESVRQSLIDRKWAVVTGMVAKFEQI